MSSIALKNDDKKAKRQAAWARYKSTLRYGTYVIFHPFDGFWDLVHEKRGSLAAANTYLVLFLLARIMKLLFTSFQFNNANLQYINVFEQAASLLLPFLILCVANWGLTTLFDGKGRFQDIYMGMCYALVPYVLIQIPLVILSNVIAYDEAAFYEVLMTVSVIWSVALVFVGLMQIHDYGPGKTLLFIIVTIVGACVIIFLMLVFFSLLSDAIGFFVSLYKEIAFRLF